MNRFVFLLAAVLALWPDGSFADQKSFDCKMRQLALDYAQKLQPNRPRSKFQQVADALNGAQEAQGCNVTVNPAWPEFSPIPVLKVPNDGKTFYVDASKGSDSNSGTESSPFRTIQHAVEVTRQAGSSALRTIVLRAGTFYLNQTVMLSSEDSQLTFQSQGGEEVWISGGMPISPEWKSFNTSGGANIYMADMSGSGVESMLGFRVNGKRAIRARYPNADPELGFGSTLKAKSWLPNQIPPEPDKEVNPDEPLRNTTPHMFQKYQLGIGGSCAHFDPPAGYWCGNGSQGGGAFTYRVPSGMVADQKILPNSPYKNPTGAVVQAWRPGHWASWMFEVGDYDANSGTFHFSKGGFQGARGNNNGDEFYIENVMEELDSPNEWFYDEDKKVLYFWYNGTGQPPSGTQYVVPTLKVLFNISATQEKPAIAVTFEGVGFRDTAYTYMDPHGMPSGGDWALQRTAALFFQGTVESGVDGCIFERLDGNAIVLSGFNRHATVQNSEFVWIGDSAIASWGYTSGAGVPGMGWDGTDGNQPRFNLILNNFVHELGIWEKQSSFYFQAKSCQNLLQGNIFFNGPRAGINFNDGFGGDSNITENILFNTCRESGDHGPFNSWDRQVFVTKVNDGSTASVIKAYDHISYNFMIANYNSQEAIDNDDGSCYYDTHHNFFAYSGNGMKNDFDGHDNHHHNNIYGYVGHGFGIVGQLDGHEDYFYNNTVVMTKDGDYGHGGSLCQGPGKTVVHDNRIFTPTGKVTECGSSLADWQKKGNDPGTTAAPFPEDEMLVSEIKALLSI